MLKNNDKSQTRKLRFLGHVPWQTLMERMGLWIPLVLYLTLSSSLAISPWDYEKWTHSDHILVTGGAGYIGSHTVAFLLNAGYEVTVVDNLVNSNAESLNRVANLTGKHDHLHFFEFDLRNRESLRSLLAAIPKPFSACIHFAGLKAVGESTEKPLSYYDNNIGATVGLLEDLHAFGTRRFVFSSSATVYGDAQVPITENSPAGRGITNAYGRTKYFIEEILKDMGRSPNGKDWSICILRYFNPVGAHPSGMIGEDPSGRPNNLMPFVAQVAVGRRPVLAVFGNDYETPDGTGVRDYIHVMDLAEGHLAALRKIDASAPGTSVYNLGTGSGYSVLQMVTAMEKACDCKIPYEVQSRRPGDLAVVYASTDLAYKELGWKATRSLDDMCRDLWTWQSQNPTGYPTNVSFFRVLPPENNTCQDQEDAVKNTKQGLLRRLITSVRRAVSQLMMKTRSSQTNHCV